MAAALVTSWSYSRYAMYEQCPLKFKLAHIDRIKEPPSPSMQRGDKLHKSIAGYIMGTTNTIEPEAVAKPFLATLIGELRAVPEADKQVEQQWGYTVKWEPTAWFGKATWFRAILDAATLYEDMWADVIDWKSGKKYETNEEQMELNGLALLRRFKPATGVTSRMVYIDAGVEESVDIPRADEAKLMAKWEAKIRPMFSDDKFLPRPNDKCRFCQFSKGKGGQCRYG